MLANEVNSSIDYVDLENGRIYRYIGDGGLDYTQAQAACKALSYPGVLGSGYPVVWNTWVAGEGWGVPGPLCQTVCRPGAALNLLRVVLPAGTPSSWPWRATL
jgi:hypothetical protein